LSPGARSEGSYKAKTVHAEIFLIKSVWLWMNHTLPGGLFVSKGEPDVGPRSVPRTRQGSAPETRGLVGGLPVIRNGRVPTIHKPSILRRGGPPSRRWNAQLRWSGTSPGAARKVPANKIQKSGLIRSESQASTGGNDLFKISMEGKEKTNDLGAWGRLAGQGTLGASIDLVGNVVE